jgi:hypothetical protein
LLTSGGVVFYWALHMADLTDQVDTVWVFVAFELVVLVVSFLAVIRVRMPLVAIWTIFTAHALLTAAALVFMLTFQITRLI